MIQSRCSPRCAFSLISWICINQSGHDINLKKTEYLSYWRISDILLLVMEFKNIFTKEYENSMFFLTLKNKIDSSFNIKD